MQHNVAVPPAYGCFGKSILPRSPYRRRILSNHQSPRSLIPRGVQRLPVDSPLYNGANKFFFGIRYHCNEIISKQNTNNFFLSLLTNDKKFVILLLKSLLCENFTQFSHNFVVELTKKVYSYTIRIQKEVRK